MECRMGMAEGAIQLRMACLGDVRISGAIVFELVPVVHLSKLDELKVLENHRISGWILMAFCSGKIGPG